MNMISQPKIWTKIRLRNLIMQQIPYEQKRLLQAAEKVTFLPMEAIGSKGELDLSHTRNKEDVQAGYTLFFDNDVLVAKITPCFENGKGALVSGLLNGVGFGTTEVHVLSPQSCLDSRFLYYVTASYNFRKFGEASMAGAAGQKRVPTEYVHNFLVDLPALSQQRQIAGYLDRETQKIDSLIAAKKRLLELLAEKRRALIAQAVTRGLTADVPMKDSGVEWLGKIPENWNVEHLKYHLSNIEQGWSPQSDNFPADLDEWGVLKAGAVNGWTFNANENKRIPAELDIPLEHEIKPGDILVSRANTTELVGSASLVKEVRPGLLLCDKIYRPILQGRRLSPDYLVFYLRSSAARFEIERDATGASSSMQNISQGTISNLWIPIPPVHEQLSIVTYIENQLSLFEKLELTTQQGISLLQERRTSLISAAVTGQLRIPN
jgi:type I restriction enzyme, S subunit